MTFEELKSNHTPIEGYSIYAFISQETGNYVALVEEKVEISRFSKEKTNIAKKNISTKNMEEFYKFLKPYLTVKQPTNV